ncbi:TPA: hypothetical protein QH942_002764 [Klebsiella aerogenes]|nr:hypothetical protein [Klebsiella aerogenes]
MSRVNRDLVASAMMSSIENYLFEILDSVENEVGALTAEDHYEINSLVRCAIEKASTELGACSMTDITRLLASLKRRSAHAKEFGDDVTFVKLEDLDALVEALEKAQGMEAYWKTQCRGITDHCEELQARIAELEQEKVALESVAMSLRDDMRESRTVTVKQFDEFQICHYGATEDYAKGYIDCQNNFFKWLTAAGIKWEAE